MDLIAYLAAFRHDADRLAAAASGPGHLDRKVNSCPGWTVADLVAHTAEVLYFWRQIASGAISGPDQYEEPPVPAPAELVPWLRREAAGLLALLEQADPAREIWTWSHEKNMGFLQRRMAQELAVHRWDAQDAVGGPEPIDAELAVDGIDEFLDHFLEEEPEGEGSVHVHVTDADGEWLLRWGEGRTQLERAHAKGDAALRGPAHDVLLALWGRRPLDGLDLIGDRAQLDRFLELGVRN